jgi:hypothetical protein
VMNAAADAMLGELARVTAALSPLRKPEPVSV